MIRSLWFLLAILRVTSDTGKTWKYLNTRCVKDFTYNSLPIVEWLKSLISPKNPIFQNRKIDEIPRHFYFRKFIGKIGKFLELPFKKGFNRSPCISSCVATIFRAHACDAWSNQDFFGDRENLLLVQIY